MPRCVKIKLWERHLAAIRFASKPRHSRLVAAPTKNIPMDILKYTETHLDFRNRLRAFLASEVTPRVDQWEQAHIVPKSAWRAMGQAGFLCPAVSTEYGGLGGDFRHSVILVE